jgi:hypothetical protein
MSIDIFSVLNGQSGTSSLIPGRDPGAVMGTVFCQNNLNLGGAEREANILAEFQHGNLPDFLRDFTSVTVSGSGNSITYLVMPDVLSIGSNDDYVRMPMNPHTAQAIATQFDCTLPTVKMVNCIWQGSTNKLEPRPWGPPYDDDMSKTYRIPKHNATIQAQLAGKDPYALTSGHKKDVVLTNRLGVGNPGRHVAIYGWIQLNGQAIQGLNPTSHSDMYEDYSHGIRLIANDCMINGTPMRMQDVFSHPVYSSLVSDEGQLNFKSY